MPELPEVETIKNELTPHVLGRTIRDVEIFWDKMVRGSSVREFRRCLASKRITGLSRRGKYLFLHLEGGENLVLHFKMTGSLLVDPPEDRFTRAIIRMDNGTALYFRDPRKFGRMWLVKSANDLGRLGPEPLADDFTEEVLAGLLKTRKAPVKPVLLDQTVIAGIGNMYADEALYEAQIHPLRPAASLTDAEIGRLHRAIRRVLLAGIARKGASIQNYIRPDGTAGTAHDDFRVAHGRGKTCPRDGAPIERIVVRGRGTYLCPKCQQIQVSVIPAKAGI